MNSYITIIAQSYFFSGSGSTASVRTHPSEGQGFSTDMFIECSREVRNEHPVGTFFKLSVKLTSADGGRDFLYSHYKWPMCIITEEEAKQFIADNF